MAPATEDLIGGYVGNLKGVVTLVERLSFGAAEDGRADLVLGIRWPMLR